MVTKQTGSQHFLSRSPSPPQTSIFYSTHTSLVFVSVGAPRFVPLWAVTCAAYVKRWTQESFLSRWCLYFGTARRFVQFSQASQLVKQVPCGLFGRARMLYAGQLVQIFPVSFNTTTFVEISFWSRVERMNSKMLSTLLPKGFVFVNFISTLPKEFGFDMNLVSAFLVQEYQSWRVWRHQDDYEEERDELIKIWGKFDENEIRQNKDIFFFHTAG